MEIHLSNPSLHAKVKETNDTILKKALDWSEAVNKTVSDLVYNIPPFIFVRESLEKLSEWADIVVCSATPEEALKREWEEHDIAKYVRVIAGQEMGTKKDHLEILSNGKYDKNNILMVGDALGDMKAAHSNGLHFFPVNPGEEEDSWEDFLNHISDVFHGNVYNKEMETKYIDRFKQFLPDTPPWKK
jgi:phosphoglycolate phosphatase-like HAD superfamily hydrolase